MDDSLINYTESFLDLMALIPPGSMHVDSNGLIRTKANPSRCPVCEVLFVTSDGEVDFSESAWTAMEALHGNPKNGEFLKWHEDLMLLTGAADSPLSPFRQVLLDTLGLQENPMFVTTNPMALL